MTTRPNTLFKGTLVHLVTTDGIDDDVVLHSDYAPTFGAWFRFHCADGVTLHEAFCRRGAEIVSVTPVGESFTAAMSRRAASGEPAPACLALAQNGEQP